MKAITLFNEGVLKRLCIEKGVTFIHVAFAGDNDYGDIYKLDVETENPMFVTAERRTSIIFRNGFLHTTVQARIPCDKGMGDDDEDTYATVVMTASNLLQSIVKQRIEGSGVELKSEKGGFGDWIWDADTNEVHFEMNRTTHDSDEYSDFECELCVVKKLGEPEEWEKGDD